MIQEKKEVILDNLILLDIIDKWKGDDYNILELAHDSFLSYRAVYERIQILEKEGIITQEKMTKEQGQPVRLEIEKEFEDIVRQLSKEKKINELWISKRNNRLEEVELRILKEIEKEGLSDKEKFIHRLASDYEDNLNLISEALDNAINKGLIQDSVKITRFGRGYLRTKQQNEKASIHTSR